MKKILYVGGFELPDKNAAAHRVMTNAKLFREMGFDVLFVGISKDIENAPSTVDGFSSTPVKYPTSIRNWYYQITTFMESREIVALNPDYVVMYNFPAIASLKILKVCHQHGIKVIHDLTEWESTEGWSVKDVIRKLDINLRMRYCMKRMDGVIAISRYLYEYYRRKTNTILVPPMVDLSAKKWNRDRRLSCSENIRFVYAGSAGCGQKDRLDIIVKAIVTHVNTKLDVIGMTKEQYTSIYGILPNGADNIIFHGRVSHMEAVKAVQDSDFQLLIRNGSRKNNAGFPTKFVESMSCSTPIIATMTSNITDYLKDGVNGFVVSDEMPLDIVLEKVMHLTHNEIISMKEACRSLNCFDYRNYKSEFAKLFV